MTIQQAKEIDMVDYLSNIGHKPIKIKEPNYWYKSPLRDEKSPSFKVNRSLNRWFDFGDGKFGNLIDFGILYHECSVRDFLHKLDDAGHNINQRQSLVNNFTSKDEENNRIKILSVNEISSYSLVSYLHARKISDDIAGKYCREVRYQTGEKICYVLGFKNNSGG
ncbi:MAG: CHC2 zinc finger domain-containing protein, partial [Chitinophagaceae bacterium]